MDLTEVVPTSTSSELAHGLDEWCTFNIADGATKLNYADIRLFICVIHGNSCDSLDPILNGIGDVRNHLDSLAQVITPPFTFDDMLVHLSGGDAVFSSQGDVEISFVVP